MIIGFLAFTIQQAGAQVVMKEFLSANHEGKIDNTKNNDGKPIYYKLEYKSTEGARINYVLYLYKDASMKTPYLTFPVLMRNLTWTYYMDVTMTKDGMAKVFALIYKKDLRWARIKYSPHIDCFRENPNIYVRLNMVDNFDQLIKDTFIQMDKNVNLNCYVTK